jgi:hypothetical protein
LAADGGRLAARWWWWVEESRQVAVGVSEKKGPGRQQARPFESVVLFCFDLQGSASVVQCCVPLCENNACSSSPPFPNKRRPMINLGADAVSGKLRF